ncbi:outer membrane protein assembly factor BamC [Colwellia sp. Arc7-635]|uniref:outer membrane protein assembly factor BamC n=1 Tax=Colwellia sp. Arc7-635 TaxID=2497879 RepID=UPI001F499663|nr:outer membrane protein assembly factor BamC [Colwellia sp. Arc7-635]
MGDTVPVVDLPEGKYQFQLEKMAEKSLVTIYDEQGTALPEATLEKIFTVMEAGLSFKNVF